MEERRKMSEMKIACIKKGRLANHEYEMARIQLKDNKLEMTRMKMELDMKRSKEEYEMEKLRMEKLKDNKMKKLRMEKLKEEKKSMMKKKEYDNGCKYVVFSAAKIYSSMPNENP